MRSMTGFGRGTYSDEHVSVTIEMRAVNQRFLELNIRMPHAYLALEDKLRKSIKETLHRGKVERIRHRRRTDAGSTADPHRLRGPGSLQGGAGRRKPVAVRRRKDDAAADHGLD